jgi:chaperonin GroES
VLILNKKRRKNMDFQPFGDKILIKIKETGSKTEGGIILPDNVSKDKPTEGEVIKIGGTPKNIEVGDTVIFTKYAGTQITLDGDDYLIIETYKDILGIIKNK